MTDHTQPERQDRMTLVTRMNGTEWEYRGITPGGMVRLWAIGGGASLTAHPSDVLGLRELARPFLAVRGAEYDRDDWQTFPLSAIIEILADDNA